MVHITKKDLDKHNPKQFEIIGSNLTHGTPMSKIAKKGTYSQGGPSFYMDNDDGTFKRIYTRILIKHKRIKRKIIEVKANVVKRRFGYCVE